MIILYYIILYYNINIILRLYTLFSYSPIHFTGFSLIILNHINYITNSHFAYCHASAQDAQ